MVRIQFLKVLGACTLLQAFAVDALATPRKEESPSIFHPRFSSRHSLLNEATEESIDEAREVVRNALNQMTKLNKARLDNPVHDTHRLHTGANLPEETIMVILLSFRLPKKLHMLQPLSLKLTRQANWLLDPLHWQREQRGRSG